MNNKLMNKQSIVALKPLNLEQSAEKIRELSKWTIQGIIMIGLELKWVKANLEHGKFENWIREELPFSPSTARRFMRTADIWEKRALTHVLDEATILRQMWGNSPKDPDIRSQQDVYTWLDKEIGRVSKGFNHLVRHLTFSDYYTPETIDKLDNMAQVMVDTVESIKSKRKE